MEPALWSMGHTQAPCHTRPLLSWPIGPACAPAIPGVKASWTSRLRKGKAQGLERWMVSFCLQQVSSRNSSMQIPPTPTPPRIFPAKFLVKPNLESSGL